MWDAQMLFLMAFWIQVCSYVYATHPEADMPLEDRVRRQGYPIDIHKVYTEDDYILSLYHIPHGLQKNTNEGTNRSAVLLIHGMGSYPDNFLVQGKKRALPYYFADRDFDVWLFCARGLPGYWKEKHRKYNWDVDGEYWFFSMHEIGVYDLAATIDYIRNETKQEKVFLVAHSAGGNEIFALLSERPEYNDRVKMAVSMASAPILKRMDYPVMIFASELVDVWKGLAKYLNMAEFLPQVQIIKPVIRKMCSDKVWREMIIIASWMVGSHESILQDPDDIEVMINGVPPRFSNRQIFHFMENFNAGEFRKFNYGPKTNLKMYGQKEAPKYNLSLATAPSAFFVGKRDSIILIEDIYEAAESIANVVMIYQVPFKKFTHTDFLFARNAAELVYEVIHKLFQDYDNGKVPPKVAIPPYE